ncbi:MAG: molybdopterin molybdotransferase MoeA [Gammaproteobacteria bacterium]|nr:molybdopterin molybdotransferase MoeA [Gammaproteobacteria bacterium]
MLQSDPCSTPDLIPFEQALALLLSSATRELNVVSVPLWQALARVTSLAYRSPVDVPNFDNSAMDGFALHVDDIATITPAKSFELIGRSMAGKPFNGQCKQGQCVRIMTGAVIPDECNAVVMQEKATTKSPYELGTQISFDINEVTAGQNIRPKGNDIRQGELLFEAGHRLKSADLGLLASLGLHEIKVFAPLKIAVFSSGDELVLPGTPLTEGKIYDSNRITTIALLSELGFEVIDLGILPDDPDVIAKALQAASLKADVIITSGGVSVGEADYLKETVERLGKLSLWKIAMKPGKPFAFGNIDNCYFLGLPGNPVSSMVTLMQLGLPFLRKLQGQTLSSPKTFSATLHQKIRKSPGRKDFQRAIIQLDNEGEWLAEPLVNQNSGVLSSMSRANGFILLPADSESMDKGAKVKVQLFSDLIDS